MEALLPDIADRLPDAIYQQLWERIAARLSRGDALITTDDYVAALAAEYRAVTGQTLPASQRRTLRGAVDSFNREHPEQYVARGLHNSVVRAFQSGCDRLSWDVPKIEAAGPRSLARFKSQDRVRGFLKKVRVSVSLIRDDDCVRHAVDVARGLAEPLQRRRADEALPPPETPVTVPTPTSQTTAAPAAPAPKELGEDAAAALSDGTVSQAEVDSRLAEQAQAHQRLQQRELERVGDRLDGYVSQGHLTSEEGETVRRLRDIDRRQHSGELDAEEASRQRNSLLTEAQRTALERKVQGAVDHAVRFLQVFESMQRISPSLDAGLRFLILHKHILDPERGAAERARAVQTLLDDREILHQVVDIMDRKDQEVRMLSVGLPPYSYVVKRHERIGNLTIDESFVDDLRNLSADDMSDRLHAEETLVRVRPAADLRCLIAIVSHLIKPTPWRKDVRMVRVQDTIEAFYHDADDLDEARKQAQSFLNRRLRRMFRDLSAEEKLEMEQRGADMIDAVEQRVIAERQAAAGTHAVTAAQSNDDSGEDALSEDELRQGATIGRVEMRIAGNMRRVPRKIMRDPEDETRFVLARRNPDTGELEPVLRRGARRVVERDSDGFWRLESA